MELMPTFQNLDRLHYPPRPANARAEVEKILRALVEDYGAEKIIAFGSAVRGGVTEHSDIDLCVIREHPPGCTHPGLEADLAVMKRPAFGHTGFTGGDIWIDPANDLFLVLLTNRVNPTRANTKIGAVRQAVADAVMRLATGSPR